MGELLKYHYETWQIRKGWKGGNKLQNIGTKEMKGTQNEVKFIVNDANFTFKFHL